MRVRRFAVAMAVCLTPLLGAPLLAPAADAVAVDVAVAAIPTPDHDPFYAPPAGFESRSNGDVLRRRSVLATTLSIPIPARAEQLLYRTENAQGRAIAEVTTVMVPLAPWIGPGRRPVVSYQTAEDSVGAQCAPSYALRAGLPAITSNAETETTLMASLLARGWAVVTSDYEGPTSNFLAGPQEGKGVLDGIRAALSSHLGGIDTGSPLGLWGYSGGAFATAWAIQQQPAYAPGLTVLGSALGGTPADLTPSMQQIDGGYGAGLVMGGLNGLQRTYPDAHLGELFTPSGTKALAAGATDCTVSLLLRYAFTPLNAFTTTPTPYADPRLTRVLADNSPIGHGAPTAPVYSYHANTDELVPVAVADRLVASYCAAGTPVQKVRFLVGEHNATLLLGAPGAQDFLAKRFAGAPVVSSCPS
jgi:hypothetical protein